MRESTMATINRTVAENTLCWCEGRISRSQRRAAVTLSASASVKFAIKWRFYTQKLVRLVGLDGSGWPSYRNGIKVAACKKLALTVRRNPRIIRVVPIAAGPASFSALLRRSFRKAFPPAVRGQGAYLWDARGKQYLDFSGSAAVNFVGHGVAEIATAMAAQAKQVEFVHSGQFTTPVAEEYAAELLEFAGKNFEGGCIYFTCGGSESVETALKLARQYQVEIGQTKRHQVISRGQSYHGSTLGALSVSGNKRRREIYSPMVREFAHIAFPYCYRCEFECTDGCRNCGQEYAGELEKAIEAAKDEVAAFIVETVSGATLGAVVPPPGYLQSVAEICRRHGVLLIADEVMSGMGRTGRNFAVEHWQVAPDLLVAAKGLSSGYAPLVAVIVSKKVADAIAHGSGAFLHGFTYNSHPISLAAGRAVLRFVK